MKKLNDKEREIVEEVKQRDDNELINIISLLNNYRNFKIFEEEGVDLENVLPYLCKEALNRNLRIETKGYLDLIPIIQEIS